MKRQAIKAILLCGSVLSMTIGCSKGDDSDVAATVYDCGNQTNLALTGSTPDFSNFFRPTGESTPAGTDDSSGLCLDKNGARMNKNTGFLVNEDGSDKTYPGTNEKIRAAGGGCHATLDGTVTGLGQRENSRQDTYAQNARNTVDKYSTAPNHKCTASEKGDTRTLEQKTTPNIPSTAARTRGMNPGDQANVPGSAGAPGKNSGEAPKASDVATLANAFKTAERDPLASTNQTQASQQTASGGTSTKVLSSPDSRIPGSGPADERRGNQGLPGLSLTAPQ